MVWGAFSSYGKLNLAFVSCRMKSSDYKQMLHEKLKPYINRLRRFKLTFQQDNVSINVARDTLDWFADNNIAVLDWPARSTDLNPMEDLWGVLVRRVYANNRQYGSVEELKEALLDAWDKIEPPIIQNLLASMPDRIFEVIHKQGSQTHY